MAEVKEKPKKYKKILGEGVYHDFAWNTDPKREGYNTSNGNAHFEGFKFYSYSTQIASKVVNPNDIEDYLILITSNPSTPTTNKHLWKLRRAVPLEDKIIYVANEINYLAPQRITADATYFKEHLDYIHKYIDKIFGNIATVNDRRHKTENNCSKELYRNIHVVIKYLKFLHRIDGFTAYMETYTTARSDYFKIIQDIYECIKNPTLENTIKINPLSMTIVDEYVTPEDMLKYEEFIKAKLERRAAINKKREETQSSNWGKSYEEKLEEFKAGKRKDVSAFSNRRRGGFYSISGPNDPNAQLYVGKKVLRTSMGLQFELTIDLKRVFESLWTIIEELRTKKESREFKPSICIEDSNKSNFFIQKIDEQGTLIAGCHRIGYSELKYAAIKLGFEPEEEETNDTDIQG
jgi:hypothetical protein